MPLQPCCLAVTHASCDGRRDSRTTRGMTLAASLATRRCPWSHAPPATSACGRGREASNGRFAGANRPPSSRTRCNSSRSGARSTRRWPVGAGAEAAALAAVAPPPPTSGEMCGTPRAWHTTEGLGHSESFLCGQGLSHDVEDGSSEVRAREVHRSEVGPSCRTPKHKGAPRSSSRSLPRTLTAAPVSMPQARRQSIGLAELTPSRWTMRSDWRPSR